MNKICPKFFIDSYYPILEMFIVLVKKCFENNRIEIS